MNCCPGHGAHCIGGPPATPGSWRRCPEFPLATAIARLLETVHMAAGVPYGLLNGPYEEVHFSNVQAISGSCPLLGMAGPLGPE